MPSAYRERYFERADGGYRISKTLRQMVIFGEQDLSRSAPFPCIDLVLCRNVLIYFTPELQQYVVNQFAFSLSPHGGYLFLGKAETVRQNHQYYEIANKQWKIYRCTNTALLRQQDMLAQPGRPESRPPRPALRASDRSANELETLSAVGTNQFQRINDVLLRSLPIGVAVVDRSYRLVTINALARRRLGVREAGFEQDFLHAVRGIPYADVRRAIDTVFRERSSVTLPEIELDATGGGTGRFVSLAVVLTQLNRTYRMWP
jgi:two-component system CheB/CheR fusion protein